MAELNTGRAWQDRWETSKAFHQTRAMLPLMGAEASTMVNLSRQDASLLVQFISGHNRLLRHQRNIGGAPSSACRRCGQEVEDAAHLLWRCTDLAAPRAGEGVAPSEFPGCHRVLAFIKENLKELQPP